MKLVKKIIIKGEIKALSGIRVGGSSSVLSIGGVDSPVIRNPLTNKPYIPGSSIKGKMRSLIEIRDGTIGNKSMGKVNNGPSENPNTNSSKLFGCSSGDEKQRSSRIIVYDADLLNDDKDFVNTDLPYTESKTEVVIDRITSAATPRTFERVPAEARFRLNMVLNIFDIDDEKQLVNDTFAGLLLIENDYLGGCGSRGYGKVKFFIQEIKERTAGFYKFQEQEKDYPIPQNETLRNLFTNYEKANV